MMATRRASSPDAAPSKGGTKLTGFVLKLKDMVDGAPDDVVSVSTILPFSDLFFDMTQ